VRNKILLFIFFDFWVNFQGGHNMEELCYLSATELIRRYKKKDISPVEAARAILDRISKYDTELNSFCYVDEDAVMEMARDSETRWIRGEPKGLVDGVPVSIKDLCLTRGWPTMFGSKTTDPNQAWDEDAPTVARLREDGAVLLGKTTTPEFGHKFITVSPLTGVTRNPWNLEKTPGGSSGGAGAAVAAGFGPLAVGTDGGGSIRIPSSWSGIYGLKSTFGRVPHYPRGSFGSLSHAGPMTRTVEDAALMMTVITRPDPRDWWSLPPDGRDYRIGLDDGVKGLKIGYTPDFGLDGKLIKTARGDITVSVDPEVTSIVKKAVDLFSDLGSVVEPVEMSGMEEASVIHGLHWIVFCAQRGRMFTREQIPLLDPLFAGFIDLGKSVNVVDFAEAQVQRETLGHKINMFHEKYDLLLAPTFHVPAIEADRIPDALMGPPPFTCIFNHTKQPAASIPCGLTGQGLPVGLQIVGPLFRDDLVLRASRAYESARGEFPKPLFT
jgi:aspartyl-tRNA(Asn)/glutamyl-tRNA(Gln) amidotransferase subunit A